MTMPRPEILERIESLKRLKTEMDNNAGGTFSYYKNCVKCGLRSSEGNALQKIKVVKKYKSREGKNRYLYEWAGGEPDEKMVDRVMEKVREIGRDSAKKAAMKRKEEKRREEEEFRAKREAEAKRIKELKEEKERKKQAKRTMQGAVIDPSDLEFVNNLKAKSEGISEQEIREISEGINKEKVPQQVNGYKIEKNEEADPGNIPISVEVTTEGNRKTVTIKIEI